MMGAMGWFCKVVGKYQNSRCDHEDCYTDPAARVDNDVLIAFATTCSDAGIRLLAERDLRRRYPSRVSARIKKARRK